MLAEHCVLMLSVVNNSYGSPPDVTYLAIVSFAAHYWHREQRHKRDVNAASSK